MIDKVKALINKIDTPSWLEWFLGFVIVLRIPSFFEPFYYGDEMIYLTLGEGIRRGMPLYLTLHDNKPPLLYIMAAIAGNVFIFKVLLAIFNLFSIYLFWKVVAVLFPKKKTFHKISTILFGILTTIPLFEGNIANAENFMMVPVLLAFLFVLTKDYKPRNLLVIGGLFSIAALFKIVAAFDILGLLAYWFIFIEKGKFFQFVKNVFYLSLGFVVPIGATFIWYLLRGALPEYVVAAFLQNLGYVSSWNRSGQEIPFLVKNGPLLTRFGVMILGFLTLWFSRRKVSKPFVLITAWLLSTLFAVTLSERPYPHYFLQSIAPISILFGMLFTFKNKEQTLTIIPLALAFFVPFFFKFWHYPTVTYYRKFINFAAGNLSKEQYFDSFSENLPRNYKIANFLSSSSKKEDSVFVWSNDSAGIYALSRRLPPIKYVADYHIVDFSTKEETLNDLSESLPKFIIITPNAPEFNELRMFTQMNYKLIEIVDNAEIWLKV